ncbi:MAG: chemotaxis-specific protein-glutamate methyltransferase CheB [Verrucomicrobia bacterium]|nr:chemotaxis-specific protein-glutamate methyltransferase CheB [Verrucomicrobiota bacterium]
MNRLRVLVADDSVTVRKRIVDVLSALPDFEVVSEAADGREAIEACARLRPDVVTLDMMMPVMTGLAATEYIMAYCPTPILVVSASTNRGELFKTYEALAAGALDVLEKPLGDETDAAWEQKLASTLRLLSRIKVITHPRGRLATFRENTGARPVAPLPPVPALTPCRLVAIGASTGGPGAVVDILRNLPAGFSLPLLVVIHISSAFGAGFADWLNGLSPFPVAFARHGERLPAPGSCRVILAPPDEHLVVREDRIWLTRDAERHSCRPSVDVLFESVARELGPQAAACLLTGMGRDGAEGLLAIRLAGGITFAQDESSSVVFGMPREAIRLGAASQVLRLDQIAPALAALNPVSR